MAYPPLPVISYDYTAFQQAQQGISAFPGIPLDNDLASLAGSLTGTIAFIQAAFRSDSVLLATSAPDSPTPPGVPVSVGGSRADGTALANLLTALDQIGLIVDDTAP